MQRWWNSLDEEARAELLALGWLIIILSALWNFAVWYIRGGGSVGV